MKVPNDIKLFYKHAWLVQINFFLKRREIIFICTVLISCLCVRNTVHLVFFMKLYICILEDRTGINGYVIPLSSSASEIANTSVISTQHRVELSSKVFHIHISGSLPALCKWFPFPELLILLPTTIEPFLSLYFSYSFSSQTNNRNYVTAEKEKRKEDKLN